MDLTDVLVIGGLLYVYFYYGRSPLSYGMPVNTVPGSGLTPVGGGVLPSITNPAGGSAGAVTSPLVIPSQSVINQQIQNQSGIIGAVAAGGTAIAAALLPIAVAGPVGAAIAAVALLIKQLISDTHLYANQLVQKYENPFGQYVIQIIQAITNELNNGTLDLTDAVAARDAVVSAWQSYQEVMHQIQTQGTDWYIVATQSLNNLDNQYLGTTLPNGKTLGVGEGGAYGDTPNYGFMSTWIDWLNQRVIDQGGA